MSDCAHDGGRDQTAARRKAGIPAEPLSNEAMTYQFQADCCQSRSNDDAARRSGAPARAARSKNVARRQSKVHSCRWRTLKRQPAGAHASTRRPALRPAIGLKARRCCRRSIRNRYRRWSIFPSSDRRPGMDRTPSGHQPGRRQTSRRRPGFFSTQLGPQAPMAPSSPP